MEDFKDREHFPGTKGGPFELLVRQGMLIEKLPSLLFALLMLGWSYLITWGEFPKAQIFFGFLILDWVLIYLLPIVGRSFGPVKPTVFALSILRTPFLFIFQPLNWIIQAIGTLLVIYAFWIEPQKLTCQYESLVTDKLPDNFRVRLVHFGDLHMERITKRDEDLINAINKLQPDLILFSGDVLSYSNLDDMNSWEDSRWVFEQLEAKFGIYAVRGSPAVDDDPVLEFVYHGSHVELLDDRRTVVQIGDWYIDIIGLSCSHKPHEDGPKLESLVSNDENNLTILLYHSPDLATLSAKRSINLQLSGHTHGGQVRLPFFGALFTASLYGKQFEMGRYKINGMTLYVTRGLGMEGMAAPRVRFLCPPEFVLWEINGSSKESARDSKNYH